MIASRIVRINPVKTAPGFEHYSAPTSKVLRVFDTKAQGDLVSVPFDVAADVYLPCRCVTIRPRHAPAGQMWAEIVDTTMSPSVASVVADAAADASARQHEAISNLEAEAAVDAGVPGSSSEQRSMAGSLSTSLDQVASRVSREHAERVRAFLRTSSQ